MAASPPVNRVLERALRESGALDGAGDLSNGAVDEKANGSLANGHAAGAEAAEPEAAKAKPARKKRNRKKKKNATASSDSDGDGTTTPPEAEPAEESTTPKTETGGKTVHREVREEQAPAASPRSF